jgi:hypothetical protein
MRKLVLIISVFLISAGYQLAMAYYIDLGLGVGYTSGESASYDHFLLIDGASHYFIIDGAGNKLAIDGATE